MARYPKQKAAFNDKQLSPQLQDELAQNPIFAWGIGQAAQNLATWRLHTTTIPRRRL